MVCVAKVSFGGHACASRMTHELMHHDFAPDVGMLLIQGSEVAREIRGTAADLDHSFASPVLPGKRKHSDWKRTGAAAMRLDI